MSEISKDQFDSILDAISTTDNGLRKICAENGCFNQDFYRYMNKHPEEMGRYAHAKELQADVIFDSLTDIADDSMNDTTKDEEGNIRVNHEIVKRSALRVDTRKWVLAKSRPKKYGDSTKVEHSGGVLIAGARVIDLIPEEETD